VIYTIFDYKADLVKTIYLDAINQSTSDQIYNSFNGVNGFYKLKEQYNTQKKIQAAFADKTDPEDLSLRDGLYALVSNVLFVVDRHNSQMYHPRISAQLDLVYRYLTDQEKASFNRLYNDYYYRRHNQFWYEEAMKKLPLLTQSTRMLVCAEDLGMVPDCVAWVMEQLKILSLEIQTMPKAVGLEFGILPNNPYRSVATISTHDMPTLRQWWEEDYERAQHFYNNALQIDGKAPESLSGWL
jgi:4-alpha-glucanotransferase